MLRCNTANPARRASFPSLVAVSRIVRQGAAAKEFCCRRLQGKFERSDALGTVFSGRCSFSIRRPQRWETMATTVDSTRETVSLIGSDKVEGTAVYGSDDNKIGSVQRVMIDKISGKVAYAVISFGGFLGMGENHYPLPWSNLKYDTNVGGYRVGITEDQLKGAPKYTRSTQWDWSDRARDREVYDYYKTPLWY
jgi:hypothetical protein